MTLMFETSLPPVASCQEQEEDDQKMPAVLNRFNAVEYTPMVNNSYPAYDATSLSASQNDCLEETNPLVALPLSSSSSSMSSSSRKQAPSVVSIATKNIGAICVVTSSPTKQGPPFTSCRSNASDGTKLPQEDFCAELGEERCFWRRYRDLVLRVRSKRSSFHIKILRHDPQNMPLKDTPARLESCYYNAPKNAPKHNDLFTSIDKLSDADTIFSQEVEYGDPSNFNKSPIIDAATLLQQHYELSTNGSVGGLTMRLPEHIWIIIKLLPGNSNCCDCGCSDGGTANNSRQELTWASAAHGTVLCEECALLHMRMGRDDEILSFETSLDWRFSEIISMLEGGNEAFLSAMYLNGERKRDTSNAKNSTALSLDEFDDIYSSSLSMSRYYRKMLRGKVLKLSNGFTRKRASLSGQSRKLTSTCILDNLRNR